MDKLRQIIAIATVCGWRIEEHLADSVHGHCFHVASPKCPPKAWGWLCYPENLHEYVPDYLNSLDAMHEAQSIERLCCDWKRFCKILENICNPKGLKYKPEIEATATQRAEAFLRTLNLWTE